MIEPYQYSELVYLPPNHEIEERILVELNKRPLTSHELSHNLRLGVHNIIYWLNILEKKGKIVIIEKCHVFYKLKKGPNRKVDLLPKSIKPIKNNNLKLISNLKASKEYSEMFFLKRIIKCDPHFRKLYNKIQREFKYA